MKPCLGVETPVFVWNLLLVYILRVSNNFAAPGRPAPELEVKALQIVKLDVLEQGPGSPN